MSVVLVDGFDTYNGTGANTGLQARWLGSTGCSMVTGRFGGQALQVAAANGAGSVRAFPASYSSFTWAGAIRFTVMPSSEGTFSHFCFEDANSVTQVGLRVTTNGSLEVGRFTAPTARTVLATSTPVILTNTWHYLEIECTISDTVGELNVYVDGVAAITLSSVDTRNGTPTTVGQMRLFTNTIGSLGGMGTMQLDDMYLLDVIGRLGERRVETLYPTSDVAQGWTRSTGATNYTLVDEATVNGDTDYVQASSVNTVDTYGFQDLTGTPAVIDAVQVCAYGYKTDATTRAIALQVISGATTSDGPNFNLTASYGKYERLMTSNPNGGINWSYLGVNALTGGPKVTI
jgi:hypothetical protein